MSKIYTIGKDISNSLVLQEAGVSRQHAKITVLSATQALLEDLDSTNGTFVNGKKVKSMLISPTDEVKVMNQSIDLKAVFPPTVAAPKPKHQDTGAFKASFPTLKAVYEKHQTNLVDIPRNYNIKIGIIQAVLTVGCGAFSLYYFRDKAQLQQGIFSGIVALIPSLLMRGMTNTDKIQAENEHYRTHYICPVEGCSKFLNDPPALIEKKGTCPCGKEKC
jgi:hypothetical protein